MTPEQIERLLTTLTGIEEALDMIAGDLHDLAMPRALMNARNKLEEVPVIVRALNHLAEVARE